MPVHIGVDKVLRRHIPIGQGRAKLGPVFGAVEAQNSAGDSRRGVEGRPAQGQCLVVRIGHVHWAYQRAGSGAGNRIDNRAVVGHPHLHHMRLGLALDTNLLAHGFGPQPRATPLVAQRISRIEALNIEILIVNHAVGDAPGHPAVMADNHATGARKCAASDVVIAAFQVGQIPDAGQTQSEVRVVGEQRSSADAARSAHHPGVGTLRTAGFADKCRRVGEHA